jgi:hypothetical protein
MLVFTFPVMVVTLVMMGAMFVSVWVIMMVFLVIVMMPVRVVVMLVSQMNVKLHARDSLSFLPPDVQVIAIHLELREFTFQLARVHAQINQRANEHVAADAAENVEVKSLHLILNRNLTLNLRLSGIMPEGIKSKITILIKNWPPAH